MLSLRPLSKKVALIIFTLYMLQAYASFIVWRIGQINGGFQAEWTYLLGLIVIPRLYRYYLLRYRWYSFVDPWRLQLVLFLSVLFAAIAFWGDASGSLGLFGVTLQVVMIVVVVVSTEYYMRYLETSDRFTAPLGRNDGDGAER